MEHWKPATFARHALEDLRRDTQLGYLPSGVDDQVQTIHEAVEGKHTTWKKLGTTPEEIERLARLQKRQYYLRCVPAFRAHAVRRTDIRLIANSLRKGVAKGEITWLELGISDELLEQLVTENEESWKDPD